MDKIISFIFDILLIGVRLILNNVAEHSESRRKFLAFVEDRFKKDSHVAKLRYEWSQLMADAEKDKDDLPEIADD